MDYELSQHVSSDACITAAALLERQQFWRSAKYYAGSRLTIIGCIAITHLLCIEHNLIEMDS